MTREQKAQEIENLKVDFDNAAFFYLADSSTLTVAEINEFRHKCFQEGVTVKVVKNTLAQKALESLDSEKYKELFDILKGPTTLMVAETANVPAKIIKEFRGKNEKPALKAAYIDTDVYVGDDKIDVLASLKSKEDLIGEVISLLQSPMQTVLGQLKSGGQTVAGLLKALEERGSAS